MSRDEQKYEPSKSVKVDGGLVMRGIEFRSEMEC